MNGLRKYLGFSLPLIGLLLIVGCRTPQQTASAQQIPRITKLYEKATATHVHRFRRPWRDQRDRLLRQLSEECDEMVAQLQAEGVAAEALTGAVAEPSAATEVQLYSLESSLAELGTAARQGDVRAMRSAHAAALAAYFQAQRPAG